MSESRNAKRPAPDAYDHLWSLLPVFVAFIASLVFFAADDRPLPHGAEPHSRAESMPPAMQSPHRSIDPSAPSAATARAVQAEVVTEHIASF
jgi:hypothetical protein